jgi:hypothetical protein
VWGRVLALEVHEPTGFDELYLLEADLPPVTAIAGLARRVATLAGGAPIDWAAIPASQLAAVALLVRQAWMGDRIISEGTCPSAGCGERFDISFTVSAYLAGHRPRRPRNVSSAGDGWHELAGSGVRFRVPSVQDLLTAMIDGDAVSTLMACCVEPAELTGPQTAKLDRALSALAPDLVDHVGGACPGCGGEVSLTFDPLGYTLAELRDRSGDLFRDTHLLAGAYHWSEESIHRLPRRRRQRYAALASELALA